MNYYHVSYQGGSCGKFIANILMFLVEEINQPMKFVGSDFYHSHIEWNRYSANLNENDYRNPNTTLIEFPNNDEPWEYLKLTDNTVYKNIYWPWNEIKNYNSLLKKYPDFKQIIITIDRDEALFVDINHYLKAGGSILFHSPKYKWMSINFKESLKLLTESQINDLKNQYIRSNFTDESMYSKLDDNLKKHVFCIKFFDIVNNPKKVLDILSTVANKPITPVVEEGYYCYINNQIEFYKKYVPFYPFTH